MVTKNKFFLLLFITILTIFGAATAGVYFIREVQGLKIRVFFSDAGGLYEKSPVEYKGIQIGSVQKIEAGPQSNISVFLKIDSDHAEHIRQHVLFVISSSPATGKPPGIAVGYCKDHDPYRFPKLASGASVRGEDSELMFMVKTRVGCFSETADSFSKALETLKQNIDNLLNSPKVHQLYKDIETLFMDLNKIAQDHIRNFMEEKGPEIRVKIEELIKELERLGDKKHSEEWKNFLKNELNHET